jgi:hypothetical protein
VELKETAMTATDDAAATAVPPSITTPSTVETSVGARSSTRPGGAGVRGLQAFTGLVAPVEDEFYVATRNYLFRFDATA